MLTLITLIHPASKWTHWATLQRHPCLSRAATSASSEVSPIFCVCRSWLTVLLQFALGRPGPLCILVPASVVLAVVYTGGPHGKHAHAIQGVLLSVCCPWFVVQHNWTGSFNHILLQPYAHRPTAAKNKTISYSLLGEREAHA